MHAGRALWRRRGQDELAYDVRIRAISWATKLPSENPSRLTCSKPNASRDAARRTPSQRRCAGFEDSVYTVVMWSPLRPLGVGGERQRVRVAQVWVFGKHLRDDLLS